MSYTNGHPHPHHFHVEIAHNPQSTLPQPKLIEMVSKVGVLSSFPDNLDTHTQLSSYMDDPVLIELLENDIEHFYIDSADENRSGSGIDYFVYQLHDKEDDEFMDCDDEPGNDSPASHSWVLPSKQFCDLWSSLFFESDVKSRLLRHVETALLFSGKNVNKDLVTWNNVILLHGPPGSGKTSLCKALAQKVSIRYSDRYHYGQLVEINSHSLFSKWFSESGKLVMKMFENIHELVQDSKALVFLLIDEVESLAKCRQSAVVGNEPTDSIRAVNALLTQIDKLSRYPNVFILTTSNIAGSLDLAFVDRADLKIFMGPPPPPSVYKILSSSLNELIRVKIIDSKSLLPENPLSYESNLVQEASKLFEIAKKSHGMSGRTLRKIPFLTLTNLSSKVRTLDNVLTQMGQTIEKEQEEIAAIVEH